jgi:hypothetical protein
MPAPKPALKYLLLPEVREQNPGNPAQWYVRCFQEQRNFFYSKEANAARARYLAMPLADLPAAELRHYGGFALTQADWAARLDALDWQVLQRVQTEGLDLLLPELGPIRLLGPALRVRFRGQVAGRHFDEAVETAKTMLALARHLGEYPAEAANFEGLTIAHLALTTLEEMVQQPGCPNLYWALTDLPCPLLELRKGLQGDCSLVAAELKLLREDAPMTEEELEKVVSHLSGVMGFAREQAGQTPRSLRAELQARTKDPEVVRGARNRLLETGDAQEPVQGLSPLKAALHHYWGWSKMVHADLVRKLPPAQIILLDEKHTYENRRDEDMKLLALAPWQIDRLSGGAQADHAEARLFATLVPHVLKARRAQARLEQRIALLRHIEALRLYAAVHNGRLPEQLAELPVPLPADPFTGKPFVYDVTGSTARLQGSLSPGAEKNLAYNAHYEVTFQR